MVFIKQIAINYTKIEIIKKETDKRKDCVCLNVKINLL